MVKPWWMHQFRVTYCRAGKTTPELGRWGISGHISKCESWKLCWSKSEWPLERPWKLLSCFSWAPWNSLAMHTLPIVRDIDRAVRGTPSSIVGENRRKQVWVSGWGPTGHRRAEIKPNYLCILAGFAGMAQSSGHQESFIVWCFLL